MLGAACSGMGCSTLNSEQRGTRKGETLDHQRHMELRMINTQSKEIKLKCSKLTYSLTNMQ